MKKLIALLVVALSSVTLPAQIETIWVTQTTDPDTQLRIGTIRHFGPSGTWTGGISPSADLSGAYLVMADLSNTNLAGARVRARLCEADLSGSNLFRADLRATDLNGANLRSANLLGADLRGSRLRAADFRGADLRGADLSRGDLFGANLSDIELGDTILDGVRSGNISGIPSSLPNGWVITKGYLIGRNADLSNADLSSTDLSGLDLNDANLTGVRSGNISGTPTSLPSGWLMAEGYLFGPGANLSSANLSGLDLTGFDLTGANFTGADLSGANLTGLDLTGANFTGADLSGADLNAANLSGDNLGSLITGVAKGNYEEIQALKPQVETNTTTGDQQALQIAELQALAPAIIANTAKVGITSEQAATIESNTTEINELKTMLEAMSVQMQQLNARLNNQQASIEEKDQQIAELSQRPTLEQVQDARAGSLVFRADEETNAVTLEFEIQSSENLQDWVAQPETVTATVPLDAEKKFVRIALAKE